MEYYIGRMVLISLISLRRLLRQRGFVSFRLLFLVTTQRVSRCSLPSLRGRGTSMSFITYVIMTSVHYVIMASVHSVCHYDFCPLCHYGFCSFCLSLWLLSIMSLWLLHHSVCHYNFCSLCHYGFCIILSVILASVHYVIMASVPLLLCLLHTLSIMSSVHSVWFRGSYM